MNERELSHRISDIIGKNRANGPDIHVILELDLRRLLQGLKQYVPKI